MKKVAKIFFIIGIITAIITGISFIIEKSNASKYYKEYNKYNEIRKKCSEAYDSYEEINNEYKELYSKYKEAEKEARALYDKYVWASYREEKGTGDTETTKESEEKWYNAEREKGNFEREYKKYKEQADEKYEEYEKCNEEEEQAKKTYYSAQKYDNKADNAFKVVIIAGIIASGSVVLGIALIILNKIREKKGRDVFYKVLLGLGIFIVVGGAIASTIIIIDFWYNYDIAMIVAFICGSAGGTFIWGYVTYKILNGKEKSFLWGFLLGIVGVIIAICTKDKDKEKISNGDKYEDLMKLKTLKEGGIITEEEFNREKEKVLKD